MNNEQAGSAPSDSNSKRISITKTQAQSDTAVELIALCQTIAEDGSLSDAEVKELGRWLAENRNSDLPAIGFLVVAVEKIIADGKVTDAERKALHEAIEAVLPIELRRSVKAKRIEVQRLERARAKLEKQIAREQDRVDAEQNTPIESFDFMVAGAHIGNRPEYIEAHARSGDPVEIAREPTNNYSHHAVQVILRTGQQIGYVPEEDARELAPLLDTGKLYTAEIKKVLTGGRSPRPVIVLDVFNANASVSGLKRAGVRRGDDGLTLSNRTTAIAAGPRSTGNSGLSMTSKVILVIITVAVLYYCNG